MAKHFYSLSTKLFYNLNHTYKSLPEDLIEVSNEDIQIIKSKTKDQKIIIEDGKIKTVDTKKDNILNELKEAKDDAFLLIKKYHTLILKQLTDNASNEERDSWNEKVIAAKESIEIGEATNEAKSLFQREASALGQTVLQRCERSLQLRGAYLNLVGLASGIKTELEINIKNASSIDEINTIMKVARQEIDREINLFKLMLNG